MMEPNILNILSSKKEMAIKNYQARLIAKLCLGLQLLACIRYLNFVNYLEPMFEAFV